jgi:23S rRNA pseudouridine955/2504/2580 synthase
MTAVTSRKVKPDEAGIRVDRWFKRHFPDLTHGRLEKLLRTGQVRVDGGRAKSNDRLESGQTIRVPPLPKGEGEPTPKIKKLEGELSTKDEEFIQSLVIYKDSDVLVLNKPPGLASQGGTGIDRSVDGLLDGLRMGKNQRPRLVHRLDRDTSGVLVIARTVPAAAALSESFRARETKKIYWALTRGVPKPHLGTVKLALAKEGGHGPLGRDERVVPSKEGNREGAKRAVTHYAVLDHAANEAAWVALMPVTGRTHQLRAHMAAIGSPIAGDFKYGGSEARLHGEVATKLHLHARSIHIRHPNGNFLDVVAPLPPHMRKTWRLFGFDVEDRRDPFVALDR